MEVNFEDWQNLDFRVAEILEVNDHPNADKLYIIIVKIDKEKRTIVAGIKDSYSKEDLIGKKIIVFTNIKPTTIRGIKSNGMLLATSNKDEIVLLIPDKEIDSGSKIS